MRTTRGQREAGRTDACGRERDRHRCRRMRRRRGDRPSGGRSPSGWSTSSTGSGLRRAVPRRRSLRRPVRAGRGQHAAPSSRTRAPSAQLLVSGEADVAAGGMTQLIQLIEEGQKVKAFCPVQVDSTEQLAGLTRQDHLARPDHRPEHPGGGRQPGRPGQLHHEPGVPGEEHGDHGQRPPERHRAGRREPAAGGPRGGRRRRGLGRPVRAARTWRSRSARRT